MDLLSTLKILNFIFTASLILWSWPRIAVKQARVLFAVMLVFFFVSTVLFFPEGRINDWLKHIPFYIGQILFYIFLARLIKIYSAFGGTRPASGGGYPTNNSVPLVAAYALSPGSQSEILADWARFLTDQGLQHILALPILFLIQAIVRLQYVYTKSEKLKSSFGLFVLAAASLVMIHVGEFVVESQNWLPILTQEIGGVEAIEVVEFLWFYLGVVIFAIGVNRLAKLGPPKNV